MNWWTTLDAYCERTGPGFWDEPFNAWTNLAFLAAAAIAGFYVYRRQNAHPNAHPLPGVGQIPGVGPRLLIAWLLTIAVGSFCFHTFATRWAALLDVGSIVGWIATYLWLQLRRVLRWPLHWSALTLLLFFAAAPLSLLLCPHGVCAYLPTLAAAFGLGLWATRTRLPGGRLLLAASGVFALSMITAALDQRLCHAIPIGTHWLWHLLNATALTLATIALTHELSTLKRRDLSRSPAIPAETR